MSLASYKTVLESVTSNEQSVVESSTVMAQRRRSSFVRIVPDYIVGPPNLSVRLTVNHVAAVSARPAPGTTNVRDFKACSLQYNHADTVTGRSVQFLLQSYKRTGSGGLRIAATRLHQNAPNHIQNSEKFSGGDTPEPRRRGAPPPDPCPGLGK